MGDREMDYFKILLEAIIAGRKAAKEQLHRLKQNGARYIVMDDPSLTDEPRVYGTMLDLCGFANIRLSGRSPLVRFIKKNGFRSGYYSYVLYTKYGKVEIYKAYPKGYSLYLPIDEGRQEISVKETAYKAALKVLEKHGIEGYVYTRLD